MDNILQYVSDGVYWFIDFMQSLREYLVQAISIFLPAIARTVISYFLVLALQLIYNSFNAMNVQP